MKGRANPGDGEDEALDADAGDVPDLLLSDEEAPNHADDDRLSDLYPGEVDFGWF